MRTWVNVQRLSGHYEEGGNLTPRLCPWNWFYFAGIQFLDASRNFVASMIPSTDGSTVSLEAFQQRSGQSSFGLPAGEPRLFFKSSETSGLMQLFYARQANREKMSRPFRRSRFL